MSAYHRSEDDNVIELAIIGIVADEADEHISFQANYSGQHMASSSISSLLDGVRESVSDPFDFSMYMDQVRNHRIQNLGR